MGRLTKEMKKAELMEQLTEANETYLEKISQHMECQYREMQRVERRIERKKKLIDKKYIVSIVFKHVWIVYDTDDFPAENIDMVAQLCEEYNAQGETIYHAVWSNQCVELWYLLHFMYMDADFWDDLAICNRMNVQYVRADTNPKSNILFLHAGFSLSGTGTEVSSGSEIPPLQLLQFF